MTPISSSFYSQSGKVCVCVCVCEREREREREREIKLWKRKLLQTKYQSLLFPKSNIIFVIKHK